MITTLLRVLGDRHARPIRRTIAWMVAAALAEGLTYALLVPLLATLLGGHPDRAWPWLAAFALAVAAFGLLRHRADLSGFRSGTTLLRGTYHRLGDHLARLPVGWFGAARVGEVSVLASRGVLTAMSVLAHLLGPFVSATVTPLAIVAVLTAYDWRLGLAALAAAPAVAMVQRWTARSQAAADARRHDLDHEAAARVVEYLRAQPVLRTGGRTGEHLLDDALREVAAASRRGVLAALPGIVGLTLVVQLTFTALLVMGTALALGGGIGAAQVVAVLVLAARGADPLLTLADLGGRLRVARSELDRLDQVLGTPPLPVPDERASPDGHDLEFSSVTFGQVLDGVSLSVPHGGRLAVVGPSGAGKSTLLRLIARFHDVDAGAVRVGGVDVRAQDPDDLMSRLAIVFQDVYLFDGTIEDNVRLGRPDADDTQVRAAAAAARLDEVVDRLPDGWATVVGEGGALLSGGERQRVAIARALLKDAPVVLLDEVTSALDPVNEAAVHDGIERLMAGRTVVLVAHRLRTVRDADQVVFLDGGRIVEQGGHDDLLRLGGRYAGFWDARNSATASAVAATGNAWSSPPGSST
ncbi:ABC transporter [Actinophytocola xinjiangensis]|uniref:ABC transporter n=1 Tax=Actinophytocola xinjiangensis TaxID=485602 RepID=A0A7Z0WQF3_9PSEU|nr:ABC transporter ATP-binding protein [Actinophytocola xinjiangensis]OLF11696.1 ABC transporter [Actinophytocola xinjiangensis]